MSKLDITQLKNAFENSQSGRGFRLDDIEQLRDFASYTRAQAAVVCNVETYEVIGQYERMRVDLSVFDGGVEHQALAPVQRIAMSEEALQYVVTTIEGEGIRCVFQVWADML